jgi:hypothetical protein
LTLPRRSRFTVRRIKAMKIPETLPPAPASLRMETSSPFAQAQERYT